MTATKNRNTLQAADILRTASIAGMSPRQIKRIAEGTCKNPKILDLYNTLRSKTANYDKKLKERYESQT